MKAVSVFIGVVVALEVFVLAQAGLVAVGIAETESTLLSLTAILGAAGVIFKMSCNVFRQVRALFRKADAQLDNVHEIPALRDELAELRAENVEIRSLLQKICQRLQIDQAGTSRRATDV